MLQVFDLPQVVAIAQKIIRESELEKRITCTGCDLRTDPWPGGADLILLSRRGYLVAASTGKPDAQDYLRQLGAKDCLCL